MGAKCHNCGSLETERSEAGWVCPQCGKVTLAPPDDAPEHAPAFVCKRCHATTTKLITNWSQVGGIGFGTLFLLWLFFSVLLRLPSPLVLVAILGTLVVVIALSATASHTTVCVVCGSSDLIPGDSPRGRELLNEEELP